MNDLKLVKTSNYARLNDSRVISESMFTVGVNDSARNSQFKSYAPDFFFEPHELPYSGTKLIEGLHNAYITKTHLPYIRKFYMSHKIEKIG